MGLFSSWTFLDVGAGWPTWNGMPFWVNITNPAGCTWQPPGTVSPTITYTLCAGFNMVSLPVYSTSITTASQLLASIPNCTAVYLCRKSVSCASPLVFDAYFDISTPAEDFTIDSGDGLFVNVTVAGTWPPPNP